MTKHKIFLPIILFFTALIGFSAQAQTRWFTGLPDNDKVQSVFITSTLWQTFGVTSLPLGKNSETAADLLKNLTAVEIINANSKKAVNEVKPIISTVIKKLNLEVLTEVSDNETKMVVYGRTDGNYILNAMLVSEESKNSLSIIGLHGKISMDAIKTLTD